MRSYKNNSNNIKYGVVLCELLRITGDSFRGWYGRYRVPNGMSGNFNDPMYLVLSCPPSLLSQSFDSPTL
jgi:hypothetical protein